MSLRRVLLLTLISCILLCPASCQRAADKATDTPTRQIVIGQPYPSMQNAPLYIAIAQGFFSKEGLAVSIISQSKFTEALEALETNQTQFLISTAEKVPQLYQQGKKEYCVIGQISTSNAYYLLARKEDLGQRQKIKGKVILGYLAGDLPWTLLYSELRQDKLNPFISYSPVENLPYEEILTVYRAGSGSYLLAEEPNVSLLEAEGTGFISPALQLSTPDLPAHTIMVKREYLKNNAELCSSFLNAVEQAMIWLGQESPANIAEVLQPFFPNYPEVILQRAVGRYKNTACWSSIQIGEDSWQKMQEIMLQEKELLEILPLDHFQLHTED